MQIAQLVFIILTIVALSVGQILFKKASVALTFSSKNILYSFINSNLIIALVVYVVATLMWLFVLKTTPLRIAYPFVALAFFIVPIMAYYFLGEKLNLNTFIGASFIALGVWISVYE